ncbi:MAG: tRNA (adenine-N1)-methyltransferase [Anaerolineales bacterium]|nr:tRNA (adenine-N1)-methyltransferase [Anaerolineales bacterium]MCS7247231.1 tRNA (adenine-N1)-methyltransferase [Anaerolineales bacterium]MDW8161042.1 tRNA (adenine-N1)-methyltransferase [Anaerolineales bacterium]MDW8447309.1 tRNA (adenine-N1)-methyltransferase [Anaerolineales bacterium]
MSFAESVSSVTQAGDLVQLVSPTNQKFFLRLTPGTKMHTHHGVIAHDDLIGVPWGSEVQSHTGHRYLLLKPTLHDLLLETKRNTQIVYPKDIGYILLRMGIGEGQTILEAGTGSGALTSAFAWFVGKSGKVISYDVRSDVQNLARKNLERLGLEERVVLKTKDIGFGFDEKDADALFLDLPNPFDYVEQVSHALKPGGNFGAILPTTNQVQKLLAALQAHHFGFLEVCEILIRYYRPFAEKLRPVDRMVAHTGFLVFARPVFMSSEFIRDETPSLEEAAEAD